MDVETGVAENANLGVKNNPKRNKIEEAMELFEKNLSIYDKLLVRLERTLEKLLLKVEPEEKELEETNFRERSELLITIAHKNERLEIINNNFENLLERINL